MHQNNLLTNVSRRGFLQAASALIASATVDVFGGSTDLASKQELHPDVLKLAEQAKQHPKYGERLERIVADYLRVNKDPSIVSGHLYSIYEQIKPEIPSSSLQKLASAYHTEFKSQHCPKLEKIILKDELSAITRLQALVELREQCQVAVDAVDNYAKQAKDPSKQSEAETLSLLQGKLFEEARDLFNSDKMDYFLKADREIVLRSSKISQIRKQIDELLAPAPLISDELLLPVGFVGVTTLTFAGLAALTRVLDNRSY